MSDKGVNTGQKESIMTNNALRRPESSLSAGSIINTETNEKQRETAKTRLKTAKAYTARLRQIRPEPRKSEDSGIEPGDVQYRQHEIDTQ